MILLVEAATTIPLKPVRNQAADHLISRLIGSYPSSMSDMAISRKSRNAQAEITGS